MRFKPQAGTLCSIRQIAVGVQDIIGLYLNPPENAVVLCVDEKSGIQALNARRRYCRWDWVTSRGCATTVGATEPPHRLPHWTRPAANCSRSVVRTTGFRNLGFLRETKKNVPSKLEVRVTVDNCATHTRLRVLRWLAARPRFYVHFSPTLCLLAQ